MVNLINPHFARGHPNERWSALWVTQGAVVDLVRSMCMLDQFQPNFSKRAEPTYRYLKISLDCAHGWWWLSLHYNHPHQCHSRQNRLDVHSPLVSTRR